MTELDAEGFLGATVGNDAHAMNDIAAQIRSLEVRAVSRNNETNDSTDEIKNMLCLESRELRKQARILNGQRIELMASELGFRTDANDFIHLGAGVTA
jgi:hypothetical protein